MLHAKKKWDFDLKHLLNLEWLETNGCGGYASSSVLNCHTRKYHGLLISKIDGFADKYLSLSKVEDIFLDHNQEYHLSAALYPNFFQNGSLESLQEFSCDNHPRWVFKFGDLSIVKEILMINGENTVLIKYQIIGKVASCKLIIRPLIALRSFHQLQKENLSLDKDVKVFIDGFESRPYSELSSIFIQSSSQHTFNSDPLWYKNFIYPREKERGYDFTEDLFSPGVMSFDLDNTGEVIVSCSLEKKPKSLVVSWKDELEQRAKSTLGLSLSDLQTRLHQAGATFIIKRESCYAITAGYHWFLEWGRDTMIALPGLTLYSGQEEICLAVLKTFAMQEQDGLVPNYLGESKVGNAYNTVDASLWFIWAIQQYYLKTKNIKKVVAYFWNTLKNIFNHYKNGTKYDIKMDQEGLIFAGNKNTNLTWMDAMVDGVPVTSRYGYAVEINALWYNALSFIAEIACIINDPIKLELQPLLPTIKESFLKTFWYQQGGYLYDFINDQERNSAIRPNQIFAVSLPYSMLSLNMAVGVVELVKRELLTPYGLRTLSMRDPKYYGYYGGDQKSRDLAYHNGTVWPWLLGHFAEALIRVTSDRKKAAKIMEPSLVALATHLDEYGIGSIAEIFSGDAPYKPDGCIAQAWSVAEILRLTYLLKS